MVHDKAANPMHTMVSNFSDDKLLPEYKITESFFCTKVNVVTFFIRHFQNVLFDEFLSCVLLRLIWQ